MKTKILKTMGLFLVMTALLFLVSCSKTADGNLTKGQKEQQDKNLEASAINEKDFTESDEDLTTVDYKEFYDQLSPHGEWVQVSPDEIGLQPKTALSEVTGSNFTLLNLLGVKDAYAVTDANVGMVYVWKPSTELGVVRVAGDAPVFVPYTNGQWVNTDAGWYFKAPTPVEETVSHYGRWVNSPTAGWLWVPGRVWAPAWVDWKQNDNYVAWAPIPPSVYLVNNTMSVPVISDNSYMIVNRQYFLEPSIYKYNNVYYDNGSSILVSDLTGTPGIVIVNNTIIDRGPDVNIFQNLFGRNIELVTIQHVKTFNEVRYSDRNYSLYSWGFKRYKNKENKRFTINEPRNFKRYDEWKERKSEEKEYRKEEKKVEKEFRKGNNGNDNGNKHNDNDNGNKHGEKHDGSDNGNKHRDKHEGNDNGNKHGDKHEGNDNGKKHDGNDNGSKHNGNDNGKGKK